MSDTPPAGERASRPLPLDGITVLDLGQIYQGPYAGFLLASQMRPLTESRPLGADNEAVYSEFCGLDADELAALAAEGVV